MKQAVIAFVILVAPLLWLLYRPRFSGLRVRLRRAIRVAFVLYFILLGFRFTQTGLDEDQLMLAGASFLVLGGVWVAAWLVTKAVAGTR